MERQPRVENLIVTITKGLRFDLVRNIPFQPPFTVL